MKLFSSEAIGIDISDRSIETVIIQKKGSAFHLEAAHRVIVPPGVIENGLITDQEALKKTLIQLKASFGESITSQNIVCSLPESRTMQHLFLMPATLTHKDLKKAIPFEAEKIIPFDTTHAYWDFVEYDARKKRQSVLYAVAPQRLVQEYMETLVRADLTPIILDLESHALVRTFLSWYTDTELRALFDIGAQTTSIIIADAKEIFFTHTIARGGSLLTQAVAEHLHLEGASAEDKKERLGFTAKDVGSALLPVVKEIVAEGKKALSFTEQRTKKKVHEIVLCGGSALIPGIDAYIGGEMSVPVRLGDIGKHVTHDTQLEKPLLYGAAVGLAMRAADSERFSGINFLSQVINH